MSKTSQENKAKKAQQKLAVEAPIEKSEQKAVEEVVESTSETPQEEVVVAVQRFAART